ncbi:MAG TPA: response regulator [Steroidobacteraceae bacterium]|nr:response regulator [Steroidobacteraceae bacterium]
MSSNDVAIIDDDASACRALGRLLRGMGFEVSTYGSAEAFLADPARERFSGLLVDIQLGGMSGLDLQQRLRAEGSRTPVIFITAHDDPAVRSLAVQRGCAGFFRKTDPGASIIETLRRVTNVGRPADQGNNHAHS